jgi:hypothetical protein
MFPPLNFQLTPNSILSIAPNAKRVGDAVDVVEPACDKSDLQDCPVIKADPAQNIMVCGRNARGVRSKLYYKVEHRAILLRDFSLRVIFAQRLDQIII